MNELRSRLRAAEADLSDVTTQLSEREDALDKLTKEKASKQTTLWLRYLLA